MPDEVEKEGARSAARDSVLEDLSRDLRDLTTLVSGLHSELSELTKQNERRWANNKAVLVVLTLVIFANVGGMFAIRSVQTDLEREIETRAEGNCRAIQTSRDALAAMVTSLRTISAQPVPETVKDPELLDLIEESRRRNERFYNDMENVIANITCVGGGGRADAG